VGECLSSATVKESAGHRWPAHDAIGPVPISAEENRVTEAVIVEAAGTPTAGRVRAESDLANSLHRLSCDPNRGAY